jgi:hypothetical protein
VTEGCATLGELTLAWNELTGMAPPASVLESCRAIANTRRDQINAMAKRRK